MHVYVYSYDDEPTGQRQRDDILAHRIHRGPIQPADTAYSVSTTQAQQVFHVMLILNHGWLSVLPNLHVYVKHLDSLRYRFISLKMYNLTNQSDPRKNVLRYSGMYNFVTSRLELTLFL